MAVKLAILNPSKPRVRRKKRMRKHKNKFIKGATMAKKRTHTRKKRAVKRHHHNPGMAMLNPRKRRSASHLFKRRAHRRHHRNPEGGTVTTDPVRNMVDFGLGAAVGAIVTPVISNMVGFTGYAKYAVQLGVSYLLYVAGKAVGMPKAGMAAAIAGAGVTAYQFAQEQGILSGIENSVSQLLGFVPPPMSPKQLADLSRFANLSGVGNNLIGYVPAPSDMHPANFAGY